MCSLLAIDLLGELFPIAALGRDKEEGELMLAKPRNPRRHILNGRSIADLLWCGIVIGVLAIGNYVFFYMRHGIDLGSAAVPTALAYQATTMTYATILLCQLVNIVQRRSKHGVFTKYQLSNGQFWGAIALALLIMGIVIYVPAIAVFFECGPLGVIDWLLVLGASLVFLALRELQRILLPSGRASAVSSLA